MTPELTEAGYIQSNIEMGCNPENRIEKFSDIPRPS